MKTCVLTLLSIASALCGVWPAEAQVQPLDNKPLAFSPAGSNGFTFDTGVLRGNLRAEGKSKGLSSVAHLPTGMTLDRSMGLFGHYRVFSANQRYGTGAWDWPSEARLQPDGSVEVRWPAAADRPFELRATYRWATPTVLDVVTTVAAKTNLSKFESFLACYFAPEFTNSLVYVDGLPDKPEGKAFMPAEKERGTWLAFPRDDSAGPIFRDGRWTFQPSPVEWVLMPRLARPLGVRRAQAVGLAAVLMSPPNDCFAVCTPQQTEPHYSMYLSLFGRDLKAGEIARARARLMIASKFSDAQIAQAYEDYLTEADGK